MESDGHSERGLARCAQRCALPDRGERQVNVTEFKPGLSDRKKRSVMLALSELAAAEQNTRGCDNVARHRCGIERQCEIIADNRGGTATYELLAEVLRIGKDQY